MPHLDFVALREPVTCRLPTDPPETKRLVRQFRRYELERWEEAQRLRLAGDAEGALEIYHELAKFALEGLTDRELAAFATPDLVRLLGAAHGKIDLVEAALGNAPSDGVSSNVMVPPSHVTPALTTTTTAPRSRPASRGRSAKHPPL